MSIATELTRLQTAKLDIKTAIEAKGVSVPTSTSLSVYDDYINQISTGSTSSWQRPSDWLTISDCGSNEIFLLVSDAGTGLAFSTTILSSGTYSIDWGDGTIETGRVSGTTYQHQYTLGSGTPCSEGYTTFKVKIFNASNTITSWLLKKHSFTARLQYAPLLDAWIGAAGITSHANMLYPSGVMCTMLKSATVASFASSANTSYMFYSCTTLESVTLPSSWGNVTNAAYMFQNCTSLRSVILPDSWGNITNVTTMFAGCQSMKTVTLPDTWGKITTTAYMFQTCSCLVSVTLPNSWGNVTGINYMFQNCISLRTVVLPTSWGSLGNTSYLFAGCYNLKTVILPTSWGGIANTSYLFSGCSALTNLTLPAVFGNVLYLTSTFADCSALKTLTNAQYFGSLTNQASFRYAFQNCEVLPEIVIDSLLSEFGLYGAAGTKNKVTSIRLTNQGSLFTGTSPQINVTYCDLSAAALNQLFTDLPTLTGKTIAITGCTGAATCDKTIVTNKGWTVTV